MATAAAEATEQQQQHVAATIGGGDDLQHAAAGTMPRRRLQGCSSSGSVVDRARRAHEVPDSIPGSRVFCTVHPILHFFIFNRVYTEKNRH